MMIVLLNGSAGSAANGDLPARIAGLFSALGVTAEILLIPPGTDPAEFITKAVAGPVDVIVAGGGDGTVSTVANALVGTGKALGVLPLGTLNHFAKDLRIPLDLEGAVRTVVHGTDFLVDVGEVNERFFVNNSSIGLYPEIVRRRNREQQTLNVGKWHAMVRAFVAALRNYRFLRVQIRTPEAEFIRTTPFVFVGNNPYTLDGFGFGGRETLDRGQLCFWLARRTRPLGLIRLGLRAIVGRLRGAKDFEAHCGEEFEIVPNETRLRVALDGETIMMKAPLRYRSRPRALRVLVPKPEEA